METKLDSQFGTNLQTNRQSGLHDYVRRHSVPSKFRDNSTSGHVNFTNTRLSDEFVENMDNNDLSLQEYAHIYTTIHCNFDGEDNLNPMTHKNIVSHILTQHHVSKGLKIFGDKGTEAVLVELKQLHDRMVIEPRQ